MNPEALERILHTQIPICKHMQVRVVQSDDVQVRVECDLDANHNHLGTAFGGSLSSLMILAAYCQIFKLLKGTGHVVLKSSTTHFKHPVDQDLCAISPAPIAEEVQDFIKVYNKRGKARLTVNSHIVLKNGEIACTMTGEFVGMS